MNAEQKIKYLPAGGIAGFVMSEEDIENLEAEELKEQYGTTGIAQFSTIGKNMANFGRHGDDTVAHVETGELIVPRALIENNPKLKESIFKHLRELGVEDPERYVVGESNNSLNPTTGLPEFFFKKLFRSVSKVVKSVGKILKKAAPIIVPIALNFIAPGLGAVWSGAIGSGITTLVQGGSVKDAFKSALLGGATGALAAGFSGNTGSFMGNVSSDVSLGTQNISDAFTQGSFAPLQNPNIPSIKNYDANPANNTGTEVLQSDTLASNLNPDGTVQVTDLSGANTDLNLGPTADGSLQQANYLDTVPPKETAFIDMTNPTGEVSFLDANQSPITSSTSVGGNATITPPKPKTMFETLTDGAETTGDYLFRGGKSKLDIAREAAKAKTTAIADTLKEYGYSDLLKAPLAVQNEAIAVGNAAASSAGPGIITKYGPSVALAGLGSYAGGAFDVPEPESDEEEEMRTGYDVYNERPEIFGIGDMDLRYIEGDPRVASKYPYYRPRTYQAAAQGGQIFPRRVGGIMPNEGIPNQDSVRAMLMPGEFVMTTDAVKGLGGGDMNKGINNMYGVMRNLEQRGRRA